MTVLTKISNTSLTRFMDIPGILTPVSTKGYQTGIVRFYKILNGQIRMINHIYGSSSHSFFGAAMNVYNNTHLIITEPLSYAGKLSYFTIETGNIHVYLSDSLFTYVSENVCFRGRQHREQFGSTIASGDLNGDGFVDTLISSRHMPSANIGSAGLTSGKVTILWGVNT